MMDWEQEYDKIYRYCYYKLSDENLAEDITQETFLRFLSSPNYANVSRKNQALPYLYTIARHLCIDEYRRVRPEELREDQAQNDPTDELLTSLAVRRALQQLGEEEQELILLRYVNEVPLGVLGKMYGLSRFALYRRLQKISQKLKNLLDQEGI